MKYKFHDGTYWNHFGLDYNNPEGYTHSPCPEHDNTNTCNNFCGAWQCVGFSYKCGNDATGCNPGINGSGWTLKYNVSSINSFKPGDIVKYYNSTGGKHAIYVTGVNGDIVT